ncbi:P27 family phage terminase small subunit [Kribbella sp. NPDC004536]|uniref:P27 family phage terminase small subunit n=1 Tax=Kribbella sp. NPDC004536 TaxID=3364106 RepID=UPI00368CC5C4
MDETPPPPGCGTVGARLWTAVIDEFDPSETELVVLAAACRCADTVAELQATVDAEGLVMETRLGEKKIHPALVELRSQSLTLARLLAVLGLPAAAVDEDMSLPRARRPRGVYGRES